MYEEMEELTPNGSCRLCDSACFENDSAADMLAAFVVCPTCGKFRFASTVKPFLNSLRDQKKQVRYKLSHYLRTTSERAVGKHDNSFFPLYSGDDFERIIESRDPTVNEKLQMLLKHLAALSEYPGQEVGFDSTHDYSVLCARNSDEAEFYLRALDEQGLVSSGALLTGDIPCTLTSSGWQELERIEKSGSASSNAFIAMWFDPSQDTVRESIRSAINASGYVPIRIDQVEHVNRIDDEIIARIRESKFLVADLTGQRNGVYFEAGFMLGLGRPVIWLCHESDLDKVHFDTRQYNTIVYSDTGMLKSKLQFRIEAIMGKGPHSNDAHPYPMSNSPDGNAFL
jgi:nucleoside 2-deoxyribosyltransferase